MAAELKWSRTKEQHPWLVVLYTVARITPIYRAVAPNGRVLLAGRNRRFGTYYFEVQDGTRLLSNGRLPRLIDAKRAAEQAALDTPTARRN